MRCLVVFRQRRSKFYFLPVGRRSRRLVSVLHTPAAKCMFNRSMVDARYASLAVEWALYTKGGSEPLTRSPSSDFTTLSLISSNKLCGAHEITPRLIQDLLDKCSRTSQADVGQDRRGNSIVSRKLQGCVRYGTGILGTGMDVVYTKLIEVSGT